jgi:predicted signal transduction protein with EAL and GGDEF domain
MGEDFPHQIQRDLPCIDLGIDVIAEGVETLEEYWWFKNAGTTLFQGYLFGRPQFEGLPALQIPTEKQLSIRMSGRGIASIVPEPDAGSTASRK